MKPRTFVPEYKLDFKNRPEVLQNMKCLNCKKPWKEHRAVPNDKEGAGTCPSSS